jgi:hypothetical protein
MSLILAAVRRGSLSRVKIASRRRCGHGRGVTVGLIRVIHSGQVQERRATVVACA